MNHSRILAAKFIKVIMALSAGCAMWFAASGAWAQDWPQWRGPNRDGTVSGFNVPQSWPTNLIQKWKVPVGVGDSTPAFVGDKLFTLGREEANEVIRCL